MGLLVFGYLASLGHQGHDVFLGQKTQERLGVGKAPGYPDELDVAIAESYREFDADPKGDAHDLVPLP